VAFILAAVGLACFAVLGGLVLATYYFAGWRVPRWLGVVHPLVGVAALTCLWIVFAFWHGAHDMPFDAGIIVLSLTLAAGAFMFALRATRLPVPGFAVLIHGLAGLFGCALLIVGLFHLVSGPV